MAAALATGPLARARVLSLSGRGELTELLRGCPPGLVFSAAEDQLSAGLPDLGGWAGRLAAKLAVADLLGLDGEAALGARRDVGLARIEVLPDASRCTTGPGCARSHPPGIRLGGGLAGLVAAGEWIDVSISHTRTLASALAVRQGRPSPC